MKKNYEDKKKNKQMMKIVLYAGINLGILGLFNINIFKNFLGKFNLNFIEKYIYMLVGFSSIFLFKRDIFLPFLGETVIPSSLLIDRVPSNHTVEQEITITPNTKVLYWASEPNDAILDNPWDAYLDYDNMGVTTSDDNGKAILKVRQPSAYKKPYKNKVLEPHIHYRYEISNGMMSRIETVYV